MNRLTPTLFLLCLGASVCLANPVPEGGGIIFGDDHVFSLKAPKGWVLDNQSGVASGLHAVFYPVNSTWKDSKAVAYARSRPLNETIKTVQNAVDSVIAQFKKNGSPDYRGKKDREIKTESGRVGIVYRFTGDKWGNYEAVCYFKEEKTINYVVLNCRDEAAFKASLSSFFDLCKSYIFINDHYEKGDPASDSKPESE